MNFLTKLIAVFAIMLVGVPLAQARPVNKVEEHVCYNISTGVRRNGCTMRLIILTIKLMSILVGGKEIKFQEKRSFV